MKKTLSLVLALLAVVAIGGVATATAGKKNNKEKVDSTVTLKYQGTSTDPYSPDYNQAPIFKGRVRAGGKASKQARKLCKKRRTIKVKPTQGGVFAKTKTNKKGRYSVSAAGVMSGDEYFAKVAKEKYKKGKGKKKKKIICKSGKSGTVTIP